jgi:ABC-2 type transport system ATP-binding protein
MPALLEADHLVKRYGATAALDGVSFDVPDGVTGLLGANGAGKSTSLKIFLGLLAPTDGHARFRGVDVRSSPRVRERIGYMPEHDCLPDSINASDFLAYLAQVSGIPPAAARTRAADMLRHVGLDEERYRPIGTYSTGMKQRVKLAQALVHDPELVLLDEPTAGLDPMGRQEMLELVRRTADAFDISMVISSHLMGDVERTCQQVIVLDAGRLLRTGTVASLTSETEALAVRVTEGEEALVAELRRRGHTPRSEHGALVIDPATPEAYDALRDAIVSSGALLYSMAPRQHSLTEVFRPASDPDGQSGEAAS